eukprot:COSAG02_NODE_118_length_35376_cov_20.294923_6_plen_107_part_00
MVASQHFELWVMSSKILSVLLQGARHELQHQDEQERQATTAKEQKRRDRLDKATGHTDSNMYVITPDQVDTDSAFGPTLSTAEAAAAQAELNTISTGEIKPGGENP